MLFRMKTESETSAFMPDTSGLSAAAMRALVASLQQQLAGQQAQLESQASVLQQRDRGIQQRDNYIHLLEELLRLKRIQQFAASSEKTAHQIHLFDEGELEAEIDALRDQLPEDVDADAAPRASRKRRQRGFPDTLVRERIELML